MLEKGDVCMSPISAPISAPFRISSPQADIPLYTSLLASGDHMGVDFSNNLLLFPIYYIDAFSCSDLRVIPFHVIQPSSSGSGVSILSIFTPAHLDLGFKVLIILDMYLLFPL